MKNILVPTDFSTESHHAFEVALQLAQRTGGQVTLLHVLDALSTGTSNFSTYGGPVNGAELPNSQGAPDGLFAIKLLEVTKQRMQALLTEAAERAPGVAVQDVADGPDFDEGVRRVVAERGIDLIVVGTQEHDSLDQFFTSTHTERLVRLAPCPVLAVKHAQPRFEVRNVVFPSDFGPDAPAAARELRSLLAPFPDATLHLLHIGDDASAAQTIQQFAQREQLPNTRASVFDASSTSAGIEEFAQKVQADLIVVPTHARSGLSRLLRSSTAEAVATNAFPPVLTFHLPSAD